MRKFLTLLFSACILFFISLPAQAGYYSPSLTSLQGMVHTWDATDTSFNYFTKTTIGGSAVRFAAEMKHDGGLVNGWAESGIGYAAPVPVEMQDLSGYDGIQLSFLNSNNSNWSVNLYVITGAGNTFYEDGWALISPGISTIVTLNFDAESVLNRDNVKGIGFEIGATLTNPLTDGNPSNGDVFHVNVSTVPEPVTVMLLGLGAFALRRRK